MRIRCLLQSPLVLLFPLCLSAQSLNQPGVVTDAITHAAISGARVSAVGGQARQDAFSDDKGTFILRLGPAVKAGDTVRIRIEKTGYVAYDEQVPISMEIPLQVALTPARRPRPNRGTVELVAAEKRLVSESRKLGRRVIEISKGDDIAAYAAIRQDVIDHRQRMTDGLSETFPLQLLIVYHAVESPSKCKPIGEDLLATAGRYHDKYFYKNGTPRKILDPGAAGEASDDGAPSVQGGFRELPEEVNVMLGKNGAHIGWWYVKATPWQPFRGTISMEISVKNGVLLFTFDSQCEGIPIRVVNNVVTIGKGDYLVDLQTSDEAIEVVDRKTYDPIFQMIRSSADKRGIRYWESEQEGRGDSPLGIGGYRLEI